MPKKDDSGEYMISETGNWNSAAKFVEKKITEPMNKAEYFKDVAEFGFQSLEQQLMNYGISTDLIRKTALERWVSELIKISKNTMFAMKKGNSKIGMIGCGKKLKKIKDEAIPTIFRIKSSNISKTSNMKVDEGKFKILFEEVLDIESEMNSHLNSNDLIFVSREEFDPSAFKERIKHRITNKG